MWLSPDPSLRLVIFLIPSIILVAIAFFLLAKRMKARRSKKPGNTVAELSEQLNLEYAEGLVSGEIDGIPIIIRFATKDKRNAQQRIAIRLGNLDDQQHPRNMHFLATARTTINSFLRRLGLSIDIRAGDRSFDEKIMLFSVYHPWIKSFLMEANHREYFRQIVAKDFSVKHDDKGLMIFRPLTCHIDDLTAETVRSLAAVLHGLNEAVQASVRDSVNTINSTMQTRVQSKRSYALGTTAIVLFAVACIAGTFITFKFYPPLLWHLLLLESLFLGAGLTCVVAMLIVRLHRFRLFAHRDALIFLAFVIPSCLVGGYGTFLTINGMFDHSSIVENTTVVRTIYYRKNKNGKNYYVRVNAWNPKYHSYALRIDRPTFNRLREAKRAVYPQPLHLIVRTKQGYLNHEWWLGLQLAESAKPPPAKRGLREKLKGLLKR